ncbi:hypothetical protein Tco_1111109 [Tanacetum coccineum]|uniref:Uncharacterized protein n=1 Tax=Tanacetum coccineum TaxID=301880 RepID=A0ABQ5ILZ3_9ASTR
MCSSFFWDKKTAPAPQGENLYGALKLQRGQHTGTKSNLEFNFRSIGGNPAHIGSQQNHSDSTVSVVFVRAVVSIVGSIVVAFISSWFSAKFLSRIALQTFDPSTLLASENSLLVLLVGFAERSICSSRLVPPQLGFQSFGSSFLRALKFCRQLQTALSMLKLYAISVFSDGYLVVRMHHLVNRTVV